MISQLPHGVPIEQNTFTTGYDSIYQRKWTPGGLKRPLTSDTGYLKNAPRQFRDLPFGHPLSTTHATFQLKADIHMHPTSSKGQTAHVRNQAHDVVGHGENEPKISTTHSVHTIPRPDTRGLPFRYAGDAATRYNPDFLKINELQPVTKLKPVIPSPPMRWSTRRDGSLHINPHSKIDHYSIPRLRPQESHGRPGLLASKLPERTAASTMGGMRSHGLVDELFDGTTTYRTDFVDQGKLPEPRDCRRNKKKEEDLVRLNQHEVSYAAAAALGTIRGIDGRLIPEKPELVHPTVWRLELAKERSDI